MKLTSPIEESKAELRQLELELRKKAALDKLHGRNSINSILADLTASLLKD